MVQTNTKYYDPDREPRNVFRRIGISNRDRRRLEKEKGNNAMSKEYRFLMNNFEILHIASENIELNLT